MKEPKIRFKGFQGEWETHALSEYFKKVCDKNTKMECTIVLTNSAEHGIIPQNDFFDHAIANNKNIGGYYIVSPDDFVYNPRVSVTAPVGPINRSLLDFQGVMSPLYLVFKINAINKDYLNIFYKTNKWHTFMKLEGNCGARFDRLSISDDQFVKMPLTHPKDHSEQQSIASYFQHLDSLIQLTTKKIESLKQVKAASLQSMFPQEGETTPRVRFKGFEGEWEKKTLGDCLTINNERNQSNVYGINDVLSVSDEVGVVNQIKLLGRSYAGKSVVNYRVLKTNQIVYTKSPLKSKPYGIIKVNKGDIGIVSVLYAVYDANENVYPDYIHYYFEPIHRINNYLLPLINKGAKNTMNISDEMALTSKIWIPSLEEQKKIADFLQALDSQITLQTLRLEKLKQIKAACLDNMFV